MSKRIETARHILNLTSMYDAGGSRPLHDALRAIIPDDGALAAVRSSMVEQRIALRLGSASWKAAEPERALEVAIVVALTGGTSDMADIGAILAASPWPTLVDGVLDAVAEAL